MAIFGIGAGKILAGVIGGALLGKGAKSKDPFTRGFVRGFAGESCLEYWRRGTKLGQNVVLPNTH